MNQGAAGGICGHAWVRIGLFCELSAQWGVDGTGQFRASHSILASYLDTSLLNALLSHKPQEVAGRESQMGHGSVVEVELSDARQMAAESRRRIPAFLADLRARGIAILQPSSLRLELLDSGCGARLITLKSLVQIQLPQPIFSKQNQHLTKSVTAHFHVP